MVWDWTKTKISENWQWPSSLRRKSLRNGLWDCSKILKVPGALYFLNITTEEVSLKPSGGGDIRSSSKWKFLLVLLWEMSSWSLPSPITQQPAVGFENCRLVSCRELNFRQEACLRLSPNLDIDGNSVVDNVAAVVVDAVVVAPWRQVLNNHKLNFKSEESKRKVSWILIKSLLVEGLMSLLRLLIWQKSRKFPTLTMSMGENSKGWTIRSSKLWEQDLLRKLIQCIQKEYKG